MLTTQALIDAALARGLREKLPGEWFAFFDEHGHSINYPRYIGPDLTAPANLYELLRFADAIFKSPPNITYVGEYLSPHEFLCAGDAEECCDTEAYGPDRTTAVLTACAKALGVEEAG